MFNKLVVLFFVVMASSCTDASAPEKEDYVLLEGKNLWEGRTEVPDLDWMDGGLLGTVHFLATEFGESREALRPL